MKAFRIFGKMGRDEDSSLPKMGDEKSCALMPLPFGDAVHGWIRNRRARPVDNLLTCKKTPGGYRERSPEQLEQYALYILITPPPPPGSPLPA